MKRLVILAALICLLSWVMLAEKQGYYTDDTLTTPTTYFQEYAFGFRANDILLVNRCTNYFEVSFATATLTHGNTIHFKLESMEYKFFKGPITRFWIRSQTIADTYKLGAE